MLHFVTQFSSLILDAIKPVAPEQILIGKKMFRPFLKHQNAWMQYFYPGESFSIEKSVWFYLQKYMIPLIRNHASSYHIQGIRHLNLDCWQKPEFKEFQSLFYSVSKGFKLQLVNKEIAPKEYFALMCDS